MIDYRKDNKWTVYVHIVPKEISGYEYDKYYVGITSMNVNRRWKNGDGYKNNDHFYNAIKKYKWDNIEKHILASNITKDEACKMEIILIKELNSFNPKYGYNKTLGGEGVIGVKRKWTEKEKKERSKKYAGDKNPYYGKQHSEKSKELIKRNHYDCSEGNNSQAKIVFQFTITGEFINKYDSCVTADKETGINHGGISRSALYNKTAGGYLWIYSDNVIFENGTYKIKDYKYRPKRLTNKEVYQFAINGAFIAKYESCIKAGEITNIPKDSISQNARYRQKASKKYGFIWRYKEDIIESDEQSGSFILLK